MMRLKPAKGFDPGSAQASAPSKSRMPSPLKFFVAPVEVVMLPWYPMIPSLPPSGSYQRSAHDSSPSQLPPP
jgi:hypothetical protein